MCILCSIRYSNYCTQLYNLLCLNITYANITLLCVCSTFSGLGLRPIKDYLTLETNPNFLISISVHPQTITITITNIGILTDINRPHAVGATYK
ncbi:hypothetical protein EB796_018194 [Bugula neritina]|uniref:Uncharacterized protein n=1 Tax=Bugula neritina TaxID=10212 RepID=A0A7J7JBW7_BUGNE|nr:hypothetical protein EB796_018194 [Bugula neritina]